MERCAKIDNRAISGDEGEACLRPLQAQLLRHLDDGLFRSNPPILGQLLMPSPSHLLCGCRLPDSQLRDRRLEPLGVSPEVPPVISAVLEMKVEIPAAASPPAVPARLAQFPDIILAGERKKAVVDKPSRTIDPSRADYSYTPPHRAGEPSGNHRGNTDLQKKIPEVFRWKMTETETRGLTSILHPPRPLNVCTSVK